MGVKRDEKKPRTREGYGLLSGIVGIFLNVLLFVIKLVVGLFIGSVAVMADAFNNLTDAAGSVVTIVGFKVAAKPADTEHPFGHGRVEEIAGLIISMVMVFIGVEFARTSISNIFNPEPIYFSWVAIGILVFGFFVKLWMYIFNNRLGKKISSNALIAVAKDARIDCVISAFTVAAIFLAHFLDVYVDGYAGLLVSLFILYQGYSSARESVSALIGKPAPLATVVEIKSIALAHEGVFGVHDLIVHNYGAQKNIATIHIEVDKNTPLTECFAISKSIEARVLADLGIDLTIHFDPIENVTKLCLKDSENVI